MHITEILGDLTAEQNGGRLPLDLGGTGFQRTGLESTAVDPSGHTRSYSDVSLTIGHPAAARAVASTYATNPVAVAMPCHRVIRRDGHPGGYRWGLQRKNRLLALEQE